MTPKDAPIFIMGIMPRSGTVWLRHLLMLHPRCAGTSPWEDWLVPNAHLLQHYVDAVYAHWEPRGEVRKEWLYESLGSGLLSIWAGRLADGRRLVTKTPSTKNIGLFFRLFPQAYLLVLIRDGRSVVESAARTSGLDYETGARRWARAAQEILRFRQAAGSAAHRVLMVRYEDLYANLDTELRRILEFLQLPVDEYDFEAARSLPVRGSSAMSRTSSDRVHWAPVEKTSEFQPLARWRHWPPLRHERFNWIAATYLEAFGYEPVRCAGVQAAWSVFNVICDVWWWMTRAPRAAAGHLPEYIRLVVPQRAGGDGRPRRVWGRTRREAP